MKTETCTPSKPAAWLLARLDALIAKPSAEQLEQELQKHFPFARLHDSRSADPMSIASQSRMTTEHGPL